MPHIPPPARHRLNPYIRALFDNISNNRMEWAGEINYVISSLFRKVFSRQKSYWIFALMIGVLVTCALELYRLVIVPYEEEKIRDHGDAYKEED